MYRKLIGLLCLGAAFSSCAPEKGTTESGLDYEFVEKGSSSKLDSGMVATVSLHQTIVDGTDTLADKSTDIPVPVPIAGPKQDPMMEGFLMMGKGDSAIFSGSAEKFFPGQMPPGLSKTATITCEVRIVDAFSDMTAYQTEMEEKSKMMVEQFVNDNQLGSEMQESGLYAKITDAKGEEKIQSGQAVLVNMNQYLINDQDTVLSKETESPIIMSISANPNDMLSEGLRMMGKGDKAIFTGPVKGFATKLPRNAPKTGLIHAEVEVVEVYENMQAYQDIRNSEEDQLIKDYVAKNTLKARYTDSGLCYIITKQGTGPKAKAGETLEVHYTGTLMETGEKFDSSVDRGKTFEFPVGQSRVIKGWDEGFMLMNEGSEGILLIPSRLGYGSRGAGGAIGPNSILRFDVEFVGNKGKQQPKMPTLPQ